MKPIVDGLYTFSGLLVGRVYATDDADGGMTVIDAGIGSAAAKIEKQLRAAGRQPTDVRRILITHAHPDHIGGLPDLQRITGAEVICSAIERAYVEGTAAVPTADKASLRFPATLMSRPPTLQAGTPVSRVVSDGEILPDVYGGLQVLYTPGHSPGHISLWQPARRVLITGDVVMRWPWGIRLPFAAFSPDMAADRRSLSRIAALDADVVCFGHGQPLRGQQTHQLRAAAARRGLPIDQPPA